MLTNYLSSRISGLPRNSKRLFKGHIDLKLLFVLLIPILPCGAFGQTNSGDPGEAGAVTEDTSAPVHTMKEIRVETAQLETRLQHTLGGNLLRRITGGAGDPIRGISRLPSISTVNDFFGVISVRGGAPGDNLYYFDRLPLGYPYHLLGIVSVVSSEVIGKIDVHPGGFGAQFGADSQAVIDIHSRPQNMKSLGRVDGVLKPSFIYSEVFLNGAFSFQSEPPPQPTTEDSSDNTTTRLRFVSTDQDYLEGEMLSAGEGYWYAFGRRSYLEPLFELATQLVDIETLVRQVPRFWSYQLKGVYKFNDTHGVVLNAVTAYDASELYLESQEVHNSDLNGPLRSENPFDVQGIHFYSRLSPQFRSILSLTRSFTENEIAFGEEYYYRTAASTYALRNDFTYTTGSENTDIEFGYLLSSTPSSVISHGARRFEEGDPDYEFRIRYNLEKVNVIETANLHRLEGYLQAQQQLFASKVLGTFGIRSSYFNLTDNLSLQPRGQLHFSLPWQALLSFSYGRYAQNPRLDQSLLGVTPNAALTQSLATHYVLELRQQLPFETKLNLAGYYKKLRDLITYNKEAKQYQNGQVGFVRGLEVSLEHAISETFDVWLAYAYTLSKRRDVLQEFHRFYTYNSPHVLTLATNYSAPAGLLLSVPLIETLDISAKWQYQSGILYAPLEGRELSTNFRKKTTNWQPLYGDWKRTAPYHRLDLSLHFQLLGDLEEQGWELGLALEIWNVYNRNNILEVRYSPNFTKEEPIYQLPIIPFVAMTLEF